MNLKPKAQGNALLMDQAREDWHNVILMHPDRFDAILYRATEQAVDDSSGAQFGDLDAKQNDIVYDSPIVVSAVESTGEDDSFLSSWDGEESMGYGQSTVILLRLSVPNVPEGSVVEFLVELTDGQQQRQYWYVHNSIAYGSPAIGFIHSCIPCGDNEQLELPTEPEPTDPDTPAEPNP